MVNPTLWYESTLIWGIIALVVAFSLGAIAMMSPRGSIVIGFLVISWLLSIIAMWLILTPTSFSIRNKIFIITIEALVVAAIFYWIYAPPMATTSTKTIIMQAPSVGNLKERTIDLSNEIMNDLYIHGWDQQGQQKHWQFEPYPNTPEECIKWARKRSNYFRFRFFPRVIAIRDELYKLHLQNDELDSIIKYQGRYPPYPDSQLDIHHILPIDIENVANRLKMLAEKIPSQ